MQRTDRNYVEIDISALKRNVSSFRSSTGKKIIAVVKANAYGHGNIAKEIENDVDGFAVATPEEGFVLRKNGVSKDILILGYSPVQALKEITRERLTVTLYNDVSAWEANEFATQNGLTVNAHIKVNTGMNRLGFSPSLDNFKFLKKLSHINYTGIFSHFAVTYENDKDFLIKQIKDFSKAVGYCENLGFSFDIIHLSNSSAAIYPFVPGNAVRIGYGLYGYGRNFTVRAITWRARVLQVLSLKKGDSVGYDRTFIPKENTSVATIGVGYGDGYPRALSNIGKVLFNGKELPIVGRICMDMLSVCTMGERLNVGDYVTLIGSQYGLTIAPSDLGFGYEILSSLSSRVKRYFI